jgi:hypothetical protein
MMNLGLILVTLFYSAHSYAQGAGEYTSKVTDVTAEYKLREKLVFPDPTPRPSKPTSKPTPAPSATPCDPISINCDDPCDPTVDICDYPTDDPSTDIPEDTVGRIIFLGNKIWDFIVNNKPNAEYTVFKTSVVPEGITNWLQLKWSKDIKPVSKVYRVEFINRLGNSAGGFDYRITYFHSGTYQGKGKYLGQISVVPTNIHLKTDRSLKLAVELGSAINFGTEESPIAGAQVIVSWSSPTTTRYEMYSAEYLIYGTGEILDLTNGN